MTSQRDASQRIEHAFSPQVAGGFYTANPTALAQEVAGFIRAAEEVPALVKQDLVGILSPHAGYRYSGRVAGYAYRAVQNKDYRTVIVMALSHRRAARRAAVLDRPAYDTPLGSLKVDRDLVKTLLTHASGMFDADEPMFEGEHSLEVQLPFIQVALPKAKIVPMIVAVHDDTAVAKIGQALFDVVGTRQDVLFVLSSDLSHFFPYDKAVALDTRTLGYLEKWQLKEWNLAAAKRSEGMCGHRPIQAFTAFFEQYETKKRHVTRLAYQNSGDTAGDKSSVVGYGALAFSLDQGLRTASSQKEDFGPYSAADRRQLMDLAKQAVAAAVQGSALSYDPPASSLLNDKGAAFVTLKKAGKLRGCIGHVIARVPLSKCVVDVARAAAIHDTRFNPVQPEELGDLDYEISVLTAPEPIAPEEVIVGRHGLIMTSGGRSGLLLPQVPIEWGWDREAFLAATCRKAGLSLDCWKDPSTKIEGFRAIVWGEEDLDE
ncbi:MAG: AmmeMemoRadiSam system protein B [Myxococcota bacterium]|nr:AmmeMemoRadiSam system protein B [Myxococcota bacterium]